MKTSRKTSLITLVLSSSLISGQAFGVPTAPVPPQPTIGSINLVTALKKGLDYSQELKVSLSQVKGAEHDTSKARGSLFPTINGVAAAVNNQNSTTLTSGTVGGFTSSNGDTYSVGLTLSQPLYAGGALTAGLNFYKTAEDITRQNYFNVKQNVVYNILTAFYALALAQELLDVAESNRDILKSYVDINNHYEKIGRSRKMDQLQSQVNYSLALADVENDVNSVRNTYGSLGRYFGDTGDIQYKPDFKAQISPVGGINLDQAFDAALKNNPTIRSAQLILEQVQYSEDLDLSTDKPSLYLNATDGYKSPDTGSLWNSSSNYYSIGLNLTVPLFSGFSSISKRHGYEEKKYQAERNLQIAKDTLRNTLENALHNLRSSKVQLELAGLSVNQGRDALELANKGYRQGTATPQDVINLQTTRYNAEKLFVNSQFTYLQSLLTLRQQMGIDLEKAYEQ